MSTVDLLRAHAPAAPERLQQRVLTMRPVARQRVRVRPLLVLAGAVTLAIGAALVHGLTTSSKQTTHSFSSDAASSTVARAAKAPALESQPAHAAGVAPAPNRIQHEDASIRVRVRDVGGATNAATRVATRFGGYAQSVRYRTGISYLELRVPTAHVKQALAQLADLGVLTSQQISIQDLTSTLERQSAQIAQLRRRVAALTVALRNPALPEAQRVLLQIKLAESKRALAQRLHGRKGTLTAGATARISLVLATQKEAAAVPHRGRVGRMLHSAVGFLALEGIVLLFALIVASPFVVVLGLLWLVRRRAVDRLLME